MTNLPAEERVPCGRRPPEWPRLFRKSDRFVKLRTGTQKTLLSDSFLPRLQHRRTRRLHRSEEHTSELQSHSDLVCRLLLEKKKMTFLESLDDRLVDVLVPPPACG